MISIWLLKICTIAVLAYDPVEFPDGSDLTNFVTRPEIKAPRLIVTKYHSEAIRDGYLFFSPYSELQDQPKTVRREHIPCQNGAHIYDDNGDLVWSGACKYRNRNVHGFRPHFIDGQYRLSLFVSPGSAGLGVTDVEAKQSHVILNDQYEEIVRPTAGGLYTGANFHEFRMLPGGQNAIITRDFLRKQDSILHNRSDIPVWCTGFREIELATGKQVFDWSPARDGVQIDESFDMAGLNHTTKDAPWDFFHINSVDKSDNGDYLVSARHTFTLYKISGKTGDLIWRLGGLKNDFQMLGGFDFHWQHHARFRFENETHTIVSLFDNHGDDANRNPDIPNTTSSAMFVILDTASTPMTARVLRKFDRPDGKTSPKLGSMQMIGDSWDHSTVFIDWAVPVYASEHDAKDRLVMEARFVSSRFNSYRAFKFPFKGNPIEKPVFKALPIAMGDGERATAMYMSWNGATEVKFWAIYGADQEADEFRLLQRVPRRGFETSWVMTGHTRFAYTEAINANGEMLGRSPTFNATWLEETSKSTIGGEQMLAPVATSSKCEPEVIVTHTVYITQEAFRAETVYITQQGEVEPTWTARLGLFSDQDIDWSNKEEDSPPELGSYAQRAADLKKSEAFGVFCVSAFALYGLFIVLRRSLHVLVR